MTSYFLTMFWDLLGLLGMVLTMFWDLLGPLKRILEPIGTSSDRLLEPSGVVLGGKIAAENKPYDDLLFSDHVLGLPEPPWRILEDLGASWEGFLKPSGALLGGRPAMENKPLGDPLFSNKIRGPTK